MPPGRRKVYWAPTPNFHCGDCGSSLPLRSTGTPVDTENGNGPVGVPNRARSTAFGAAMVPASALQMPKAPVVLVPGTGVGGRSPIALLTAPTRVFAPTALPAVFG